MIYWHVMLVVLVLTDGSSLSVSFPFPDAMSCGDALPTVVEVFRDNYDSADAFCRATELPSGGVHTSGGPAMSTLAKITVDGVVLVNYFGEKENCYENTSPHRTRTVL